MDHIRQMPEDPNLGMHEYKEEPEPKPISVLQFMVDGKEGR